MCRAGRREHREGEAAAGPQHRVDLGEEPGQFAGQEVTERPEGDDEIEGGRERQGPGVAAHPCDRGPVGGRHPPAGDVEHAGAEVDPGDAAAAQSGQQVRSGAGAAAQVQSVREGAERGERLRHGVQHGVGRPEGGVIELRREQVVAVLHGGQRLHGQLAERGAFGTEHDVSL